MFRHYEPTKIEDGSTTVIDFTDQKARSLGEIWFTCTNSREAEWCRPCIVADSSGGGNVVVVERPVSNNLQLQFGRSAGWTQDVRAVKPEL